MKCTSIGLAGLFEQQSILISDQDDREETLRKLIKEKEKELDTLKNLLKYPNSTKSDYIKFFNVVEKNYHKSMRLTHFLPEVKLEEGCDFAAFMATIASSGDFPYPKLEVRNDSFTFYLPPAKTRNIEFRTGKSREPMKQIVRTLLEVYIRKYGDIKLMDCCEISIVNHLNLNDAQYKMIDPDNIDFKRFIDGLVGLLIPDDSMMIVNPLVISCVPDTENYTVMTVKKKKLS